MRLTCLRETVLSLETLSTINELTLYYFKVLTLISFVVDKTNKKSV
jgi:hypothetical protein